MAKKSFEIQGSTLRIGGLDLEAGTTSIVIPGVTQATTYSVDEVRDFDDEQSITFESTPVIIDIVIFNDYVANGSTALRAEYEAELEDDGTIDDIEVNYGGVYSEQDYNDIMGATSLLAYTGTAGDPFSPFVTDDWTSIPFRVKMRAGEVENIGGSSGGGVVERSVELPGGESGDTRGTIALTPDGDTYICIEDWEEPQTFEVDTAELFATSQTGGEIAFVIPQSAYSEVSDLVDINNPTNWTVTADLALAGEDTWTVSRMEVNPITQGDFNGQDAWWFFVGTLGLDYPTQTEEIPAGTTVELSFSPAIWERIVTGSDGLLGDLTVENGSDITNANGGITLVAESDILLESSDDIRLTAADQLQLRSYGDDIDIITNYDDLTEHTWSFGRGGEITFPDGTVQTTAYNPNRSEFVLVNSDGGVYGSTDGENWSGPFGTGLVSIRRVAVGPSIVVYIGGINAEDGDDNNLHYTTAWNVTPAVVTDEGPANWRQVRYFSGIDRFVAVGSIDGAAAYKYSSDGITWVTVYIDSVWSATLAGGSGAGPSAFTDVATNGFGFMLTTDNTVLGSFYTTTLTSNSSIGESAWLNDGMDFREVVYSSAGDFTGWFAFGIGGDVADGWWYNGAFDPGNDSFALFLGLIGESFVGDIGYQPMWSELAIGRYDGIDTIVIATGDGQIAYWPAVPNGPFVSIPKPFFTGITGITSASPAVLSYLEHSHTNNEKIVISDVAGFNGTYYINSNNELFTDSAMTVPFDATLLTYISGGVVTFSHGQYIDALNYANGNFYVANDDEEVFVSTDGGATWTEVASLNPGGTLGGEGGDGPGTGTQYMNDIDGFVGTTGSVSTGDITFNGVKIIGAGTASGDGYNAGTIELVPDNSLYSNDQYLVIEPTVPNHIHIRAGGTQDDSNATLILGGENANFTVTDYNNSVYITTYNSESGNSFWNFGNTGTTTFPTGGNIILSGDIQQVADENLRIQVKDADDDGYRLDLMVLDNTDITLTRVVVARDGVNIITDNAGAGHSWDFSAAGTTTLPGAVVNSTVDKTGVVLPTTTGIPETLSGTMTGLTIADDTYGPFTIGGVTFSVIVSGGGIAGFSGISSTTSYALYDTIGQLTSGDLGDPSSQSTNIGVDSVVQEAPTAIDLTKTVNKLSGETYSLADGVEGQILYFVPAGTPGPGPASYILVANARIYDGISGPTDTTDYSWTPFSGELSAPTTIAMAIFADGAWCLRGGATD